MGPEPTNAEQRDPVQDRLPQAREASTSCLAGSPGPAHPPRAGRRPGWRPGHRAPPPPSDPAELPSQAGRPLGGGANTDVPGSEDKVRPTSVARKVPSYFPHLLSPTATPSPHLALPASVPGTCLGAAGFPGGSLLFRPPPPCHRALCPSDRALGVTSSRKRPSRQTRRW